MTVFHIECHDFLNFDKHNKLVGRLLKKIVKKYLKKLQQCKTFADNNLILQTYCSGYSTELYNFTEGSFFRLNMVFFFNINFEELNKNSKNVYFLCSQNLESLFFKKKNMEGTIEKRKWQ